MPMLLLPLLLAVPPPPPSPACDAVPGVELVTAAARTKRFVVMGERHGTVAAPRLFAALVCHVAREKPVNVMLEFQADTGPAVDAYLASDGGAAARATFLANELWDPRYADGRNSTAMFDLVEALRVLKRTGAPVRVFATQPVSRTLPSQFYGELERANDWATLAAKHPEGANLILVGSAHAAMGDYADLGFVPAAGHLSPADVFAIGSRKEGGTAWSMTLSATGEPVMGPQPVSGRPGRAGIVATTSARRGWNARYGFGAPARPSPPARASAP